jgi:formate hydrogenlyase regulatory protein HycA
MAQSPDRGTAAQGDKVGEQADGDRLDIAVPGVRLVVNTGRPETPEPPGELTTREALSALLTDLSPQGVVSVERLDDPSEFAMACPVSGGRFRIWYEDSGGHSGGDTVRANNTDAAKALHDWAVKARDWEYGFDPAHAMPVPDRIPIAHEPGRRTDLIGAWDDGLFFAGFCRNTYLHLFDHDGKHVRSHIGIAEEDLGTDDVRACMSRLEEIVKALPGHRFGDIAVRLFRVEHGGRKWGLFDRTDGHRMPHVEMEPDSLGFNPPWNGLYDT